MDYLLGYHSDIDNLISRKWNFQILTFFLSLFKLNLAVTRLRHSYTVGYHENSVLVTVVLMKLETHDNTLKN